ncbi:ADP-ribose pyrophosphatase [Burkholderia pseudomallei]|uniref:NUDIX domain-containing protein n=1 Tax=Burkholderia pseudomallei TaxID=28450 RepID=UPI0009762E3C|nr:NUDIX domain-containing protein [Burkholderia pseudomallei]OMT98470.1 ADP-ribose pyrophosphatase [Burkholderia pseudomallei]
MQHTEQPRVGCGAAIVRDGRILLIKRKRAPEAGCWGLPGGKVDWLEPVERAVCREIEEELGIALERATLLCVVEPDRHEALGWFALDDLPQPLTHATRIALEQVTRAA